MKTLAKTSTKPSVKNKDGIALASNKGCSTRPAKGSSDIYQKFIDLIIEKLEQGVIPWKQPWHEMGIPSNYLTKKLYKGINLWLLLSCCYQ